MMANPRCHWVRDRLPLLVGDDLRGADRRRVERHLIGCPQCRQHQAALGQSLEILRTAAATSPAQSDAPSLWPALARQIRESRRPNPEPALAFPSPLPLLVSWLRHNPWPAFAFGLGPALLAAAIVTMSPGVIPRKDAAVRAHVADTTGPIAPAPTLPLTVQTSVPVADSRRELPPTSEPSSVEARHDYDLELGRPMPPDRAEARDTRLTY
jgi:anti-sigma factor RsiW